MFVFVRVPNRAPPLGLVAIASYQVFLLATAYQIVHESEELGRYDGDPCVLRNGTAGVCRPADQCDWVMENPQSTKELVTCSFNMSLPIVCCVDRMDPVRTVNPAKRISEMQCEQFPNATRLVYHIFNGVLAQFGEFPHMAALGYGAPNGSDSRPGTLFRCGASLISPRFLLTAAHCLREPPVFARLGVLELQPVRVVDEPLDITIRNATPHPDYHPVTYANDIALLELEHQVTADWPFVIPACLYRNGSEPLEPGVVLSVQGWGTLLPGETELANRLMKANVSTVEREVCEHSLPLTRRNRNGLHRGQICALGRNERNETSADTCPGDSGGPLELIGDERHYLVGVTSVGFSCGSPIPGIYTEIAPYLDWIEAIVWPKPYREGDH